MRNRAAVTAVAAIEMTGSRSNSLSALRTCQEALARAIELLNLPTGEKCTGGREPRAAFPADRGASKGLMSRLIRTPEEADPA